MSTARLAHHFDDLKQQHQSVTLGMWLFLATEVMFFGGVIGAFLLYRSLYLEGFQLGSEHQIQWAGFLNTIVLLTSSLTVVLAVWAVQSGNLRWLVPNLVATVVLGLAFLGIKSYEYYDHYVHHLFPGPHFAIHGEGIAPVTERHAELYYCFYYAATGLHAFHMIIGIGLFGILALQARRGRFGPEHAFPIELSGLYWHFVDIVWVFLYPFLYLLAPLGDSV